ncbi:hypothetical protein L7F22_045750 [Adiantum nelumboides]|nr:hypothetical protein [Adiantum nelumboides]
MFPSCWNGQLDSPTHMDHVAYPEQPRNGACPEGYDQRLPSLFLRPFTRLAYQRASGTFTFSNGDETGNGYHGDFVNGWEDGVLQQAIDNTQCTSQASGGASEACPVLQSKVTQSVLAVRSKCPRSFRTSSTRR